MSMVLYDPNTPDTREQGAYDPTYQQIILSEHMKDSAFQSSPPQVPAITSYITGFPPLSNKNDFPVPIPNHVSIETSSDLISGPYIP